MAKSKCSVVGCTGKHYGKGFCSKHYQRWARHGDPLFRARAANGELLKWIYKVVATATPDKCEVWPYRTTRGYGVVCFNGVSSTAHRVSLSIFTEENPSELVAAHGPCHNRLCCNPHHLSWKTPKENTHDMFRDSTVMLGEKNHRAKLTDSDVLLIRKDKRTNKEIAIEFGISASSVSMIKSRTRWKHV